MDNKHICLPFASEAQYREYVDDPAQYRQYLSEMLSQYPELFPNGMDQGFTFHDAYASVKQDLIMDKGEDARRRLRPAPLLCHALHDWTHRCDRKSPLPATVGGTV